MSIRIFFVRNWEIFKFLENFISDHMTKMTMQKWTLEVNEPEKERKDQQKQIKSYKIHIPL